MVGILTFHRAINYGAVLQTYALQTALSKLNIENEVIDYRSEAVEDLYIPFRPFVYSVRTLSFIPKLLKKNRFEAFIKKNIKLSEEYSDKDSLVTSTDYYDKFITGSDQVWCKKCALEDPSYFLDFVSDGSQKASYAASIGNAELNGELHEIYSNLLADYDIISVRENSAKDIICKAAGEKDIVVNIDPTLLLNSEDWDKVRSHNVEKKPYILIYTVLGQYKLIEQAKAFAQKKGLRIIYLNDSMLKRIDGIEYKYAVSPQDFVGYFAEAEYIFTNSFHGTAFSIIYNKNFVVEIEAKGRRNIRSEELLTKLGLTSRFLTDNSSNSIEDSIDWKNVKTLLDIEQNSSKEYLRKICS